VLLKPWVIGRSFNIYDKDSLSMRPNEKPKNLQAHI